MQCGHQFEKIQTYSAADEKECPKCRGELERLISAPSIQFKGSGWYVNDYASKSSASKSGSSQSGEAKNSSEKSSSSDKPSSSSSESSSPAPAAAPTSTSKE